MSKQPAQRKGQEKASLFKIKVHLLLCSFEFGHQQFSIS